MFERKLSNAIGLMILILVVSSCSNDKTASPSAALPTANAGALKAHIEFLAHDLLEGRDTGSRGYDIAAQYVVSHFRQYGLTPAGDNGSYLQNVTFRQRLLNMSKTSLTLHEDTDYSFSLPEQFVTSGSSASQFESITAPLVFVGYGISAPHLDYDDYANIDVTNKIVVLLNEKPANLPSEEAAHFASRHQRALAAAKHGAIGMIYLQTPQSEKRYAFARMKAQVARPAYTWLNQQNEPGNWIKGMKAGALLSQDAAARLLQSAPHQFSDLVAKSENQDPLPHFDLGTSATIQVGSDHRTISSPNVVGYVEGSDPELKNEYIVYSAHLDHIGIHSDHDGADAINNGAMDNASGTAIMLETARLFAENPPKRSVLFIAVTGEEKGLQGSDYFAQNPTVPVEQLVANINLDMPLILYPIGDVIAFGAEHSTLGRSVQNAAEKVGLQLSPDPMPQQNIFVRSDHYSFVKQGVPAVFLVPGFKSLDESIDGGKIFQQFFVDHYHQPSDQADLNIDYEAGTRFTEVNYLIGVEIANSERRPQWLEGDFFGDTFGR